MINFEFYTPTRMVFGKETETQAGAFLKAYGAKRVLLHYGSGSVVGSGLLKALETSIQKEGIFCCQLGGVVPNPRLSLIYQGIELCKKEKIDFILAVGGGSVMDSAKAIGYGAVYEGDVWDFYGGGKVPVSCLPLGAVPTIAASGSEMGSSSVITKEEGGLKRSCKSDLGRFRFAILNPELTYSLPAYHTASGCVDIMMHTMERYFNHEKDNDLTDNIGEDLIKTVMKYAPIALREPQNYNARAQIMWAGSLSHNGLTGCGSVPDWASHQIEHELGGMFDIIHGAGLSAIWGSWARYVCPCNYGRFAEFGIKVMGISSELGDERTLALAGIERMEEFFRSIQMPTSIGELGITLSDSQLDLLAYKCTFMRTRTIGSFMVLKQDDIRKIYEMAR